MIEIYSFGYLHPVIGRPEFDITVDIRQRLRDPHVDPAFRQLNGFDEAVKQKVLSTPGAMTLVHGLVSVALAMRAPGKRLSMGVGCAGGRHRSVVLADAVWLALTEMGLNVQVKHLDVAKGVVERPVMRLV